MTASPDDAAEVGSSKTRGRAWPRTTRLRAAFFYGRREEAAELLRLVRLASLTVVYGKSGLGKTSLLQAGLFPLLRAAHYLPVHLRLDFSDAVKDRHRCSRCCSISSRS